MIIDSKNSPIVIFGAPRSGTTYLTEILNQHPEVEITNEVRIMAWAHQVLNVLPQDNEMIYNERSEFVAYLKSRLPGLIQDFYGQQHPAGKYWGDKNPHYAAPEQAGCLETIASLFPQAHFIHVIRDGRDVVASVLRLGWADFEDAHTYWKQQLDVGCAFGQTQPDDRYLEVRYEDLVADDMTMAEKMFDFLGIEIASPVRQFCQTQQQQRIPAGLPTRDLTAGVMASNWARRLTVKQQTLSLDLLGPYLVRHGYESADSLKQKQQRLVEILDEEGTS
jgi:hypothetical protein